MHAYGWPHLCLLCLVLQAKVQNIAGVPSIARVIPLSATCQIFARRAKSVEDIPVIQVLVIEIALYSIILRNAFLVGASMRPEELMELHVRGRFYCFDTCKKPRTSMSSGLATLLLLGGCVSHGLAMS